MASNRRQQQRLSWTQRIWVLVALALVFFGFRVTLEYEHEEQVPALTAAFAGSNNNNVEGGGTLAYRDSLGFFVNETDSDWILRREIARRRQHNSFPDDPTKHADTPKDWYQENWDPDFSCAYEDKIGLVGDGHKWVCDLHRISSENCIIYSVGSNGDFSFEVALQERLPSCEIHIFDLTDYSQSIPQGLRAHFHPFGLKPSYTTNISEWKTDFTITQPWSDPTRPHLKFKTLAETTASLGHDHADIFKIDCEGCEWQSYLDWVSMDLRQILVETHGSPSQVVNDFFQGLHDAGYVMFHKEPNIQFAGGNCQEFGFLKMAKSFFAGP